MRPESISSKNNLQDTDPAVSISIDVRDKLKLGEVANINYPALRETLTSLGAPEDNSRLSINFQSDMKDGSSGHYKGGLQKADIKISYPNKTQATLQHELTHHVDFISTGKFERQAAYTIGHEACSALPHIIPTLYTANLAEVINLVDQATGFIDIPSKASDAIELSSISVSIIVLGVSAVSLLYYADKYERHARKNEKLKLPLVFSIDQANSL